MRRRVKEKLDVKKFFPRRSSPSPSQQVHAASVSHQQVTLSPVVISAPTPASDNLSHDATERSRKASEPKLEFAPHSVEDQAAQSTTTPSRPTPKNIWLEAVDQLSEDEKTIIRQHVPQIQDDDAGSLFEDLVAAGRLQQTKHQSKNWKLSLGGREVNLRDMASRIVGLLEKVKAVGDIAVNVDPLHAGIPWAAIRLILKVVISDREQMAALLLGLDRVIPSITIRVCSKSKTSRIMQALWTSEQINDFDQKRERLERDVDIAATNCERLCSRDGRADLRELLQQLKEWKSSITHVDAGVTALWTRSNEKERSTILQWTSGIPYEDHHGAARTGRTEKTGEWLLQRNEFRTWMNSEESMILWLHGIPGAGKTKLVSKVIDHLSGFSSNQTLAYFYCKRDENLRCDPDNVLRCFVRQLSISPGSESVRTHLVELYKMKESKGFASAELSFEESLNLLEEFVQIYSQATLILDALDEVNEGQRQKLIHVFSDLVKKTTRLKVFISSRRNDDIKSLLEMKENISISATDNENDITKYLREKIDYNQKERRYPISDNLKTEIVNRISSESDGMFQWAALQIDQVLSLSRESDIRKRLGQLPEGLTKAYDEIFTQIKKSDGSKPEIAARALQWVMCAIRPLGIEELVVAVCQDPDNDTVQQADMDINFVLDACRNLLVIDEQQRVCRLSHLSVHEFLDDHWNSSKTNGMAAKVCLVVLNYFFGKTPFFKEEALSALEEEDLKMESWVKSKPFFKKCVKSRLPECTPELSSAFAGVLIYSSTWWTHHVRNHGDTDIDSRLSALLKGFLGSINESGPAYRVWNTKFWQKYDDIWYLVPGNYSAPEVTRASLQPETLVSLAVCLFGFNKILSEFWEDPGLDPEAINERGESLLVLAVMSGSTAVAQRLIDLGADVNRQLSDMWHGSALVAAAGGGQIDMVEVLVNSGADIKMEARKLLWKTAIEAAAYGGHVAVIKRLGEMAAERNVQLALNNALVWAVRGWQPKLDTLRLLVELGADVNAQGELGTPLSVAARGSHLDSMTWLLDAGADANAHVTQGRYGSALAAAVASPYGQWADSEPNPVKLLLQSGADVNMPLRYGRFGTALIAAVAERVYLRPTIMGISRITTRECITTLVEAGADINAQANTGNYDSALVAAVCKKDIKEILLLVELGADVSARFLGGKYGSALEAAQRLNCSDDIKLLLVLLGADSSVSVQDHVVEAFKIWLSHTVIPLASQNGYEKILKLLLEQDGITINARDGSGNTALSYAAMEGHENVVKLLLRQDGIDINPTGIIGSSPLLLALRHRKANTAKLLLNHTNIDISIKDSNGNTALLYVASSQDFVKENYNEMITLLLERENIDINARNNLGKTALLYAAERYNVELVKLLLEHDGIDINIQDMNGRTALSYAAERYSIKIAKMLLEQDNIDVNIKDKNGKTALLYTAERYNAEVVKLLLEHEDIDINIQDNSGCTALSYAAERNNLEMVQLLLEHEGISIKEKEKYRKMLSSV
ncbi:hypothetical protein B7463_g6719, partial [Scytalidium lignicola]